MTGKSSADAALAASNIKDKPKIRINRFIIQSFYFELERQIIFNQQSYDIFLNFETAIGRDECFYRMFNFREIGLMGPDKSNWPDIGG